MMVQCGIKSFDKCVVNVTGDGFESISKFFWQWLENHLRIFLF